MVNKPTKNYKKGKKVPFENHNLRTTYLKKLTVLTYKLRMKIYFSEISIITYDHPNPTLRDILVFSIFFSMPCFST
jgi:hypothetical protein